MNLIKFGVTTTMNQVVFDDFGRRAPLPERKRLRIGDAVAIQAVLSLGYSCFAVIGSHIGGLPEKIMRALIEASSTLTAREPLTLTVQLPRGSSEFDLLLQRHVLMASLCIASILFLALRKSRLRWATEKMFLSHPLCAGRLNKDLVREGYHLMGLGAVATLVVIFYTDCEIASVHEGILSAPWSFFCVPLLTTLSFAFACNAASLKLAARASANE